MSDNVEYIRFNSQSSITRHCACCKRLISSNDPFVEVIKITDKCSRKYKLCAVCGSLVSTYYDDTKKETYTWLDIRDYAVAKLFDKNSVVDCVSCPNYSEECVKKNFGLLCEVFYERAREKLLGDKNAR